MRKPLTLHFLELPQLFSVVTQLPANGKLGQTSTGLIYLKVDDEYIHRTHALLGIDCQKPDYFRQEEEGVGAHISVFYPEEAVAVKPNEINQSHHFHVEGLFFADLQEIRYYALKVTAPSLVALRRYYGKTEKLSIKNHLVDMHITVGTTFL